MKAAIVANGELRDHPRLVEIWRTADLRIAADGGAVNARKHLVLAPHVLIGDFDSVDETTREWCIQAHAELIQHPREKNETDLELAIDLAVAHGATDIAILGALGGRFDQMLANTFLLIKPGLAHITTRIVDSDFDAWLAWDHTSIHGKIGETLSLIPMTDHVDGIVTNGLRYPLRNETLFLGSPRGVSNELVEENAAVTFQNGLLLVVHLLVNR